MPNSRRSQKSSGEGRKSYLLPLTKNDNCQSLGIISKGLNPLENFPAITLNLESLTLDEELRYEIQCQNVQERPPHESYNFLKHPFLPLAKEKPPEKIQDLEHPEKLAFALASQYQLWKNKLKTKNVSSKCQKFIKKTVKNYSKI